MNEMDRQHQKYKKRSKIHARSMLELYQVQADANVITV